MIGSRWACALVAAALVAPAVAGAQDVAPRSHVVREGDTLWEIARLYLRDPFLWPEVYRLNTAIVEDPHWIFPGEQLALPDPAAFGTPIITETVATEESPPRVVSEGPTVFSQGPGSRSISSTVSPRSGSRTSVRLPPPPIREWDYYAAPWVEAIGGPRDFGKILQSSEVNRLGNSLDRERLSLSERLYISTPPADMPQRGDRYLVYSLGPVLSDLGQVVIPTGIVEVERPGEGDATTVRIVKQFDEITTDQRVTPLDTLIMPVSAEVTPIGMGLETHIRWLYGQPLLATTFHYVVLQASNRDGIRLGDRFTFLRPRTRADGDVVLPEEEIAVAQVIRVTDRGVTAIVVDQRHPAIREGTLARLTARMP